MLYINAKLTPNNCYSVKSAAVSFLVSKKVPQEQIDQALHYRSGKSVMSKHYATLESLKVLLLLSAQSVDVLYSKEMLRALPTAEVSPPEEKLEERYKRRVKYVINKTKDQLSKESDKRMKEKREGANELMKELDKLNDELENGGLSDDEESVIKNRKKLLWKRINKLKESGQNTEPPRYTSRSQTTPDVILQLPPLPPAPETDGLNKEMEGSVSQDFPK
jgi:soluble cytochrome b562